jgi:hypothetical protein
MAFEARWNQKAVITCLEKEGKSKRQDLYEHHEPGDTKGQIRQMSVSHISCVISSMRAYAKKPGFVLNLKAWRLPFGRSVSSLTIRQGLMRVPWDRGPEEGVMAGRGPEEAHHLELRAVEKSVIKVRAG